jgi:hypothetical protein
MDDRNELKRRFARKTTDNEGLEWLKSISK